VKPSVWPDWLDHLWAKSAGKGEDGKPETLAQHTWYVLERLSDFIRLRPTLPDEIGVPRLWHILFWAAFLHDFGKAASGFQDMLYKRSDRWPHRHEVLSLAFIDWLATGLTPDEQEWIAAAIVSHHKDASRLQTLYPSPEELGEDQLASRVAELDEATLHGLWRWLATCGQDWLNSLGLANLDIELCPLLSETEAVMLVQQKGSNRIHHWLKIFRRFVRQLDKSKDKSRIIGTLTLRGYLVNSDHSASAHAGQLPAVNLSIEGVLNSRRLDFVNLFEHQKQAAQANGSVLLTAPTGSGKTEAALLWAARQMMEGTQSPRLLYTLPYQASMNAMRIRLNETFGKDPDSGHALVGLQHGRALLAYYRMLLDEDENFSSRAAAQQARWAKNLAELNYPPVRVFSPYQMLKGMYRLKGYEALLSDYHHALFIFDEIHAYEVQRLALILKTIEFLRKNFQARFMVMSATFPTLIKEWLQGALGSYTEINADNTLFEAFQRHRLHLLVGELVEPDNLDRIIADALAGKSVLVVCNLVARAQEVYGVLSEQLEAEGVKVELLHGRFNMRDRSYKEQLVRDSAGRDETKRRPIVLVATQAVEVSLDIDLDTIYTDPAPLEALVQRFGRINRRCLNKNLADVYVFWEWDRKKQKRVYQEVLVEKTLEILDRENGRAINEGKIGAWLDEIYAGEVAEQWREEYQQAADDFEGACVKSLRAFESSRDLTRQFYQAFDGREVLPLELQDEYEHLKGTNFISAAELLVPIREGHIHQLRQLKRISDDYGEDGPLVVDVPYNQELGLDFSDLSKQMLGIGWT
jgi:CRISPR-associated endonuclease/helicase Cas3